MNTRQTQANPLFSRTPVVQGRHYQKQIEHQESKAMVVKRKKPNVKQ